MQDASIPMRRITVVIEVMIQLKLEAETDGMLENAGKVFGEHSWSCGNLELQHTEYIVAVNYHEAEVVVMARVDGHVKVGILQKKCNHEVALLQQR